MSPDNKNSLHKQKRLLHQATDLFRRKAIADGLKISEATLDGWMRGGSEMPDTMLNALAHLLVKLAGKTASNVIASLRALRQVRHLPQLHLLVADAALAVSAEGEH